MANVRKFLFFDPTTGVYKEQTATDTIQVANGVESLDAVNKGQLDAAVSSASAALDAEIARAEAAEAALQSAIDGVAADLATETARATAAEGVLTADLATEVAAREAAITSLNSALSADILAEQTRAQAAEAALAQDILDEQGRAEGVEASLQSQITSEVSARESAITSLNSTLSAAITAEETRALAAEGVLQSNIDAEESARIDADSALQTALDGEIARATAAEGVLTADLASEVAAREAAVSAEASARQTADEGLAADIAAEEVRALAAEGALDAKIDTEISDRIAAVSAEESARIAGDAATLASAQAYADGLIEGISFKSSVMAAMPTSFDMDGTQINLPADFADIAAGVGASAGDRILLIQPDDSGGSIDAGIYVVQANLSLSRSADFAVGMDVSGAYVYVESGVVGSNIPVAVPGTSFVCSNQKGDDVVGTADLDFAVFQRVENLTFENGVEKNGLTVSVKTKVNGAIGASEDGVEVLFDSTLLTVDGSGNLTLAAPLAGGKTSIADSLHGHSRMTKMRASTSASASHFCKYDGAGASWESSSCYAFVEEKDGSNNAVLVLGGIGEHASLSSALSAFSVGETVYLGGTAGSFSTFGDVPSGKWAIPVGKKEASGALNVSIGTALLKA